MSQDKKKRVIAYIDGFNLYHGLRDAEYRRYYWLDLSALARNLLKPDQTLRFTKYFTARIAGPKPADSPQKTRSLSEKRRRQATYLDALGTLQDFRIYHGHYLAKEVRCRQCGATWSTHEEKMTDVNIASELLLDAFDDAFDVALLVSADSDLVSPVREVDSRFPDKQIVIAFPPKRHSHQLERTSKACFRIGRGKIKASLLPEEITTRTGHVLHRPDSWK